MTIVGYDVDAKEEQKRERERESKSGLSIFRWILTVCNGRTRQDNSFSPVAT